MKKGYYTEHFFVFWYQNNARFIQWFSEFSIISIFLHSLYVRKILVSQKLERSFFWTTFWLLTFLPSIPVSYIIIDIQGLASLFIFWSILVKHICLENHHYTEICMFDYTGLSIMFSNLSDFGFFLIFKWCSWFFVCFFFLNIT